MTAQIEVREETAARLNAIAQALQLSLDEYLARIADLVAPPPTNGHAQVAPPSEPEVSLTRAADLLNVSTNFVQGLLARNELPSTVTAGQPTIKLSHLLAYKKRNDAEAAAILDELTAQAQELKMGYE